MMLNGTLRNALVILLLGLGFAAANVIGLAVVKYLSSSNPNAYES